jgi:probable F420-dependent oxidoreductase
LTQKLELATGVLILPQRQTALVAKQAAEVDILSGGRLRLAVGSGWNWVEYGALGQPFEARGRRLTEQVELLRRLWREPVIDFRGEFDRVDRAGILPQPGRIPIWFGGFSEVALRRAAQLGDGFMFGTTPTRMAALCERQKQLLKEAGREAESFGLEATVDFSQGPDVWRKEFETWRELGGTQLSLRAMDTSAVAVGFQEVGYRNPADYIDALEKFRDALR